MDGAVNGSATSPAVHSAWVDLLARLWLAEVACTSAAGRRQLQALGYRRTGTARRILARERAQVAQRAIRMGVVLDDTVLLRRIGVLAEPQHLPALIGHVSKAYDTLLTLHLESRGQYRRLVAWCEVRRRIHLAQAQALGDDQASRAAERLSPGTSPL